MPNTTTLRFPTALALALGSLLASCSRPDLLTDAIVPDRPWSPTGLPMFEGDSGRVATWSTLIDAIADADVIVLGEEHDDAAAHRFQLAILEQMLATWPDTVLALEMVERDEADALESYLEGRSTSEAFLEVVAGTERGRVEFAERYMPMIDAARERSARVVAANAPRRYVRMGRTDGWEALRALPTEERALFVIPDGLDEGDYRRRIETLMEENGRTPNRDHVDSVLRSQQIWDSTMADSTIAALRDAEKVVLIIGRFHGDFGDGTVQELKSRSLFSTVFYASTINEDERTLRPEDRDRADLVIYTGGVPSDPDPIDPDDDLPAEPESDEPAENSEATRSRDTGTD